MHPRKIAINALKDEGEAEKVLKWLIAEINTAWKRRGEIEPRFEGLLRPGILERNVAMARGRTAKVRDLSLDPQIAQLGIALDDAANVSVELADGVRLGEGRAAWAAK